MLANRTPQDAAAFQVMGDRLWRECGSVAAAHVCYLIAGHGVLETGDDARVLLVGSDHISGRTPDTFVTPVAIMRTEAVLYAQSLGRSLDPALLDAFQPFRLVMAMWLADLGSLDQARAWCASVRAGVQNRPPLNDAFAAQLDVFEARLYGRDVPSGWFSSFALAGGGSAADTTTTTAAALGGGGVDYANGAVDTPTGEAPWMGSGDVVGDPFAQPRKLDLTLPDDAPGAPLGGSGMPSPRREQEPSTAAAAVAVAGGGNGFGGGDDPFTAASKPKLDAVGATAASDPFAAAASDPFAAAAARGPRPRGPTSPKAPSASSSAVPTAAVVREIQPEPVSSFVPAKAASVPPTSVVPAAGPGGAPSAAPAAAAQPTQPMQPPQPQPPPPTSSGGGGGGWTGPFQNVLTRARGALIKRVYGLNNATVANVGSKMNAYYDKDAGRWVFPDDPAGGAADPKLGPPPVKPMAAAPAPAPASTTQSGGTEPVADGSKPPPAAAGPGPSAAGPSLGPPPPRGPLGPGGRPPMARYAVASM